MWPLSVGPIKGPATHHGWSINNGLSRFGYHPHKSTQTRSIEQVTMGLVQNTRMSVLLILLCRFSLESGSVTDTITSFQPIKDSDYIISNGSTFKLGFFSPVNSTNRYLGIWYNKNSAFSTQWVWVAN